MLKFILNFIRIYIDICFIIAVIEIMIGLVRLFYGKDEDTYGIILTKLNIVFFPSLLFIFIWFWITSFIDSHFRVQK